MSGGHLHFFVNITPVKYNGGRNYKTTPKNKTNDPRNQQITTPPPQPTQNHPHTTHAGARLVAVCAGRRLSAVVPRCRTPCVVPPDTSGDNYNNNKKRWYRKKENWSSSIYRVRKFVSVAPALSPLRSRPRSLRALRIAPFGAIARLLPPWGYLFGPRPPRPPPTSAPLKRRNRWGCPLRSSA